jgi:dTDP-4-dehydrorhamnose reductase
MACRDFGRDARIRGIEGFVVLAARRHDSRLDENSIKRIMSLMIYDWREETMIGVRKEEAGGDKTCHVYEQLARVS